MEGDLRSVLREAARIARDGERGAIAWMVHVKGSGPQVAGSRLVLRADGRFVGTVGGGAIEAAVLEEAERARDEGGPPRLRSYQLTAELGMCCGGVMEVLVEPILARDRAAWETLAELEVAGGGLAILTDAADPRFPCGARICAPIEAVPALTTSPTPLEPVELRDLLADFLEAARRSGADGPRGPSLRTLTLGGGQGRIYVETFEPVPRLVLFGAGHVGKPVAHLAKMLGFHVTVVDDREAWANHARFPDADELVLEPYVDFLFRFEPRPSDTLIIVTRGHEFDQELLAALVDKPSRYLGMIGSRAKVRRAFLRLEAAGVPPALIARVRAPIGLNLGAQTPEEIAIAIAAELVAESRGKPRPPGYGWWREQP